MPSLSKSDVKLADLNVLGLHQVHEDAFTMDTLEILKEREELSTIIERNYDKIESHLLKHYSKSTSVKKDAISVLIPSVCSTHFSCTQISIPFSEEHSEPLPRVASKVLVSNDELSADQGSETPLPTIYSQVRPMHEIGQLSNIASRSYAPIIFSTTDSRVSLHE